MSLWLLVPIQAFSYNETTQDTSLRLSIQKKVDSRFHAWDYISMSGALIKINKQLLKSQKNERVVYHLDRAKLYLQRMQKTVANSSEQLSPGGFLKRYETYMHSPRSDTDRDIVASCLARYDAVDAVAKRENFPTVLILATWRKESSCRVVNPSNGDGLFQIVAHSYPATTVYQLKNLIRSGVYSQWGEFLGSGWLPRDLDIDTTWGPLPFVTSSNILEEQVMDFIRFSRAKRKWYDSLQVFDEIPVSLSYDAIDLLSLRKHAILYNGFAKGRHPENSFYANQNFGRDYEKKQDGLVTLYLKILENIIHDRDKK